MVLAEPIFNPDPKLIKEFQELCDALLYVQVHTILEIRWALSLLTKHMTKAGPSILPQHSRFFATSTVDYHSLNTHHVYAQRWLHPSCHRIHGY